MSNIMKRIDLLDQVTINIFKGLPTKDDACPVEVSVVPLDQTKKVVFDDSALKILNSKLTDKIREMSVNINDENALGYIKEFTGRMLSELYRNGLVVLEDLKETEDHYGESRKQFKN